MPLIFSFVVCINKFYHEASMISVSGKPASCIRKNKGKDQLLVNLVAFAQLINAFVFTTGIVQLAVQFLYLLYFKCLAIFLDVQFVLCQSCTET